VPLSAEVASDDSDSGDQQQQQQETKFVPLATEAADVMSLSSQQLSVTSSLYPCMIASFYHVASYVCVYRVQTL